MQSFIPRAFLFGLVACAIACAFNVDASALGLSDLTMPTELGLMSPVGLPLAFGLIRQKVELPKRTYVAGAQYDTDTIGQAASKLALTFSGKVTAGGGTLSGVVQDAPYNSMGRPEIKQGSELLVRADGRDLRHLTALLLGGYPKRTASTPTTGADGAIESNCVLDLAKLMPNALIDARGVKVSVSGTFGALTEYGSTNVSSITADLRARLEGVGFQPPAGYWRPRFEDRRVPIESAGVFNTVFQFPREQHVRALYVRVHDASAAATAPRVDGLVRRMRLAVQRANGRETGQIFESSWAGLRNDTAEMAGWSVADYDEAAGVALIYLHDDENEYGLPGVTFHAGDQLTVYIDTAETVEAQFTAVTGASGDYVLLLPLAFDRVGAPAGGRGEMAASGGRARRR